MNTNIPIDPNHPIFLAEVILLIVATAIFIFGVYLPSLLDKKPGHRDKCNIRIKESNHITYTDTVTNTTKHGTVIRLLPKKQLLILKVTPHPLGNGRIAFRSNGDQITIKAKDCLVIYD